MMVDWMGLILFVLGVACAVLGWFSRQILDAVQKLRADLSALEVRIGNDYVRYDRLQDMFKPIMSALDDIRATLSAKADKS